MAFHSEITEQSVFGNKRIVWGRYLSDSGDTGGEINTGLSSVSSIWFTPIGSSVEVSAPTISNVTVPYSPDITIITVANGGGLWFAVGL